MQGSGQQYVLFELSGQSFAVAADCVREIVRLDATHTTPLAPSIMRGVTLLRGQTVSLLDLRLLLGMRGYRDVHRETIEEFKKRRQDHINWLTELENSVREGREFRLALDPHKCAFGRWYDQYRPDDPVLSLKLSKFDKPHQRIHALGLRVRTMVDKGMHSEAARVIDQAREQDLAVLLQLFDETLPLLVAMEREVVILVSHGARQWGLVVDDAREIHRFEPQDIDELPHTSPLRSVGDWVKGVGLKGDQITVLLECSRLLESLVA
jgi:chemotaxis signal transduction protein